jgi:endonuclease/exonuclease/phosphatase family metal-dependent hydrolase
MHTRFLTALALIFFAADFDANSLAAQGEPDDIAVMTFNIRYDNPSDPIQWDERRSHVVEAIRYYDIVGVQEALEHQYAFLAGEISRFAHYGVGRDDGGALGGDGAAAGEFCPIFWNAKRFDLLHSETLWLNEDGAVGVPGWDADLPRIATDVMLYDRNTGQTIRVINTHFSHSGPQARESAATLIRLRLRRSSADFNVLLGDLNAEVGSPALTALVGAGTGTDSGGLSDAHDLADTRCRQRFGTFTGFDTAGLQGAPRIDHILTDCKHVTWFCVDERIIRTNYISDHLPVYVMLRP